MKQILTFFTVALFTATVFISFSFNSQENLSPNNSSSSTPRLATWKLFKITCNHNGQYVGDGYLCGEGTDL